MKLKYWTQTEAARHCGCSEAYIRAMVKDGRLRIVGQIGRGQMLSIREVLKWNQQRKRKGIVREK